MCGDSTVKEDVERLMDGRKADMIFTDPPYGVSYVGKTKDALKIENDGLDDDGSLRSFLSSFVMEMLAVLEDGGPVYVAAPARPLNQTFADVLKENGVWRQTLNWVKDSMVLGRSDYHYRHEPIFYGWKPGKHVWYGDRTQTTVWEIPRPKRSAEHPTMKPVALVEKALINSSQESSLVYDPFLGSGTTLIACENLGRTCYSLEIDPKYVDVCIKRFIDKTGKDAIRLNDGKKWSEVSIQ